MCPLGVDNGLVLSWKKNRMRHDKRKVKYTMEITPQRYHSMSSNLEGHQEDCRVPVERFYELVGTKASERKLTRDAAIAAQLLSEGFSLQDLAFAMEWAVGTVAGVKSFGLIPHIMHQAMRARGEAESSEEARREAEVRIDEQLHREREERDRKQRLAEIRAALPEEALATLRHCAEGALAAEGVARTRLGYEVLVKLKVDELLEQEYLSTDAGRAGGHVEIVAT